MTLLLAASVTIPVQLPRNGKVIDAEVVTTPEETAKGLAGRKSLPPDSGMLFVYPGAVRTTLYLMKYEFPVDILYLDDTKTIINLQENLVPCQTPVGCGYDSIWMYRYALQLPAGSVKRLGIHGGDVLSFDLPHEGRKP